MNYLPPEVQYHRECGVLRDPFGLPRLVARLMSDGLFEDLNTDQLDMDAL